jgi:exodeoxyribonuclease V beta subunit
MTSYIPFDLYNISLDELQGKNLIEASAGTGKTYCIENIVIRYLLEKRELNIKDILVVTFTNAATKELKSKINKRIQDAFIYLNALEKREDDDFHKYLNKFKDSGKEKTEILENLKLSLTDFDEVNIFTIHSFCERLITENAFDSNKAFAREVSFSEDIFTITAVSDFWRNEISTLPAEVLERLKKLGEQHELNLDFDAFVKIASIAVNTMSYNVIPYIDSSYYEQIKECIDVIKDKKSNLKSIYIKIKEKYFGVSIETDPLYVNELLTSLEDYFYDEDKLMCDSNTLATLLIMMKEEASKNNFTGNDDGPFVLQEVSEKIIEDKTDTCSVSDTEDASKTFLEQNILWRLLNDIEALNKETEELLNKLNINCLIYLRRYLLSYISDRIEYLKDKEKKITFNNQLLDLYCALKNDKQEVLLNKIKSKYKIALVDEFQDTDVVQYEIIKKIFNDKTIYLIGDPKQSIYKFRGADIYTYLKAKSEVDRIFTLNNNFRSANELIKGFNSIFGKNGRNDKVFVLNNIVYIDAISGFEKFETKNLSRNIVIKYFDNSKIQSSAEAKQLVCDDIVAEISHILNNQHFIKSRDDKEFGRIEAKDIAVIVPANEHITMLRSALNKYKIPVVAASSENVFSSEEALELKKILLALGQPANLYAVRVALTTSFFNKNAQDIYKTIDNEEDMTELIDELTKYQAMWQDQGFYSMMRTFINEKGIKELISNMPGGERKMNNLLHLIELIHKASKIGIVGISETIKWLDEKIKNPDNNNEEFLLRLESDECAVNITTIHKSKGLEYPIVFFPFFWSSVKGQQGDDVVIFHEKTDDGDVKTNIDVSKSETNKKAYYVEELAEDVRLFYVGVTRAACKCYIYYYYNASKGHNNRPSAMHYIFNFYGELKNNVDSIGDYFKKQNKDYNDKITDLKSLEDDSAGCVKTELICRLKPEELKPEELKTDDDALPRGQLQLKCDEFNGTIKESYAINSYTSMVSHTHYSSYKILDLSESQKNEEIKGIDEFHEDTYEPGKSESAIFDFERSTKAGIFFHSLMQDLDFTSDNTEVEKLIKSKLYKFRMSKNKVSYTKDTETLKNLVTDILNINLFSFSNGARKDCLRLKDITNTQKLTELEFYLYLEDLKRFKDFFRQYLSDNHLNDFLKYFKDLNFSYLKLKNFLHGFIDLIFSYKGKYYIIDWKFNYLGGSYEYYESSRLKSAVAAAHYYLQYHLYLLALYKYLKYRDDRITVDDIGGVFYIFARGVKNGNNTGIFFHRPINFVEKGYCSVL